MAMCAPAPSNAVALPSAKAGEERKVKVDLGEDARKKNPQAKVRAREGYVVK